MAPPGVTGTWADEPFALITTPGLTEPLTDPVVYVASHMANVHNTFIRALNTIYLSAPYVITPSLAADFAQYSLSLGSLIHLHHSTEEALLFPALSALFPAQPSPMDTNKHQHDSFQPQLVDFNKYCEEIVQRPEAYSAEKIKALIDAFAANLMEHLVDEVTTIMQLREHGKEVMQAHEAFEVEVRKKADTTRVGPITLLNTDKTFEDGRHPYPVMPSFAPYVIKHVISWKYRGAWKFGCCDYWGRPKTLWYHNSAPAKTDAPTQ